MLNMHFKGKYLIFVHTYIFIFLSRGVEKLMVIDYPGLC